MCIFLKRCSNLLIYSIIGCFIKFLELTQTNKIMQKIRTLLCFSLLIFFAQLTGLAQDIRNVDIVTNDDKMIITYDLFGKKSTVYNVALMFTKEDDTQLRPRHLTGDVGNKITPGEGKSIIWDVYKDVDELKGAIEPVWKVQEAKSANVTPMTPTQKAAEIHRKRGKKKKVRVGWKSTLGSSNVITNLHQPSYVSRLGMQGGLFVRWNVAKRLYVQPEFLYSRQSFKHVLAENLSAKNNLHYANGQVLLGLSPFKGGLFFNGGAYYGKLLKATEQFSGSQTETNNLLDRPELNGETASVLTTDYGYLAGVTLSFAKGGFAMGVLYSHGLNNVNNVLYTESLENIPDLELNNKMLQFYFQFGF